MGRDHSVTQAALFASAGIWPRRATDTKARSTRYARRRRRRPTQTTASRHDEPSHSGCRRSAGSWFGIEPCGPHVKLFRVTLRMCSRLAYDPCAAFAQSRGSAYNLAVDLQRSCSASVRRESWRSIPARQTYAMCECLSGAGAPPHSGHVDTMFIRLRHRFNRNGGYIGEAISGEAS